MDLRQPVSEFGGYFANNSRFPDAVVDFYDRSGSLIGELSATIPKAALTWTWNGWRSDTPIGSIVITGNDAGFFHGFIWYDDFEVTVAPSAVPEPASWALLATACLPRLARRRFVPLAKSLRHEAMAPEGQRLSLFVYRQLRQSLLEVFRTRAGNPEPGQRDS